MIRFFLFGGLFGFVLSRAGATDYTKIEKMFLLQDLHLVGVIGVAIVVAGIGMFALRKLGVKGPDGKALAINAKPRTPGNLWGGLLFGAGWALTGTCPGTALAQLGEGKLTALFTVSGILIGTQLYRLSGEKVMRALSRRPATGGSSEPAPAAAARRGA